MVGLKIRGKIEYQVQGWDSKDMLVRDKKKKKKTLLIQKHKFSKDLLKNVRRS